ncbi:MAG: N-acetyltransferase family protein [Gammaproteobacteria bacterium]
MDWTLREATPADAATLLPLVTAYHDFEQFDTTPAAREAAVRRLLDEPALGGIWLVLADGHVAGYLALCLGFSIEFGGHDAFVDEFYLAPEFRGRGGGSFALAAVREAARGRGVAALHLEVARDNARARALYRKVGFVAREKYVIMTVAP